MAVVDVHNIEGKPVAQMELADEDAVAPGLPSFAAAATTETAADAPTDAETAPVEAGVPEGEA